MQLFESKNVAISDIARLKRIQLSFPGLRRLVPQLQRTIQIGRGTAVKPLLPELPLLVANHGATRRWHGHKVLAALASHPQMMKAGQIFQELVAAEHKVLAVIRRLISPCKLVHLHGIVLPPMANGQFKRMWPYHQQLMGSAR